MSRKRLLGFMFFLAMSLPHLAAADEESARQHFLRGKSAYQRGDYHLAIKEWQSAYAASQKPRIHYNLAQAYERLGELSQAVAALKKYLESADPRDAAQNDAAARLSAIEKRLAATGIVFRGGPDGATILIDNKSWGLTPRPDKVKTTPGSHSIVIKKRGFHDFVSNVIVPPGQVAEIEVSMEDSGETSGTDLQLDDEVLDPSNDEGMEEQSGTNPLPFYIISGVLAASAIGSAIWMVDRMDAASACDNPPQGAECSNQDDIATQNTIALSTTIALGAGALGVLLYAVLSDVDESDDASAGVSCTSNELRGASCAIRF